MRNKAKTRLPLILTTILGLLVFVALGVSLFITSLLSPVNPKSATPQVFVVGKGDSVQTIGNNLTSSGLIRSPIALRLAVYLEKIGGKIQAGEYKLAPNQSTRAIAQSLTRAIAKGNLITIPEGYRLEQIAELAESKLGLSYQEVVTSGKAYEGYLFPDTYNFAESTTAQEFIDKLKETWELKIQSLPAKPTQEQVNLAAIVEREALTDAEKPVVAGILQKRMREDWALEVDATIQYMLGKKGDWWKVPLLNDRKLKSPYNTYQNLGLPPAPICNPGLVSMKAVLSPKDSPYYFYLHDKTGNIRYATTNEEHVANINKYIR